MFKVSNVRNPGSIKLRETFFTGYLIYPNPTNDLITIESDNFEQYYIEFTSVNGQLIFSKEMEGTPHQIDLTSFQKGIYIITVRSKDFVTTRKIVKL